MARGRAVALALGLGAGILIVAGAAVLLKGGGENPPDGLVVETSRGTEFQGSIKIDENVDTAALATFSTPLSPVYDIEEAGQRAGRFRLAFEVPPGLEPNKRQRIFVATRERKEGTWRLIPGQVKGTHFLVEADHLSHWQLRLPRFDFKPPSHESIERTVGVRASAPKCADSPTGLRLAVDDPTDILLEPCLDLTGNRTVLRVANNRAVGTEFDLPPGTEVIDSQSPSLGEAAWREIYKLALPGDQHMLPGAGSVSIALDELPSELTLRATNSAIVLDLLIDVAAGTKGGSANSVTPLFLEGVRCLHTASRGVTGTWDSAADFFGSLRDVAGDCLSFIAPNATAAAQIAIVLPKLAYSTWDSVRVVFDSPATVAVSALPRKLLPAVLPSDDLYAEKTGVPGTSCGVVEGVIPRTGNAVSIQVVVDAGSLPCLDARGVVHNYVVADNPCIDAGNTCVLDVRDWRCAFPTVGGYPRIVSCSRSSSDLHVLGLDARGTLARPADTDCGTKPGTEIPGPFGVQANISCLAAQLIARSALRPGCAEREGECISVGFTCKTRHKADYVYETACSLDRSLVRFEQGD